MILKLLTLLFFVIFAVSCVSSEQVDENVANAMNTKGLFQGDIAIQPNARFGTKQKHRMWQNGTVYYRIHKDMVKYRRHIEKAIKVFERETCVRFIEKKSSSIFSSGKDYIEIINGTGCWSFVGRQSGKQQLSLGPGCVYHGTILHEMMHALGFGHMHSNHNRDKYLQINWHNIREEDKDQFTILHPQWYEMSTFDYSSIMLYGSTAFSKDDVSPTMEHKYGGKLTETYEKRGLSNNDLYYINKLYNCPRKDLTLKATRLTLIK